MQNIYHPGIYTHLTKVFIHFLKAFIRFYRAFVRLLKVMKFSYLCKVINNPF